MRVVFEDVDGRTGVITPGLEVAYAGDWRADVESCVERVEDEQDDGTDEPAPGRLYSELVIELSEVVPIVEIEQVETPDQSSHR